MSQYIRDFLTLGHPIQIQIICHGCLLCDEAGASFNKSQLKDTSFQKTQKVMVESPLFFQVSYEFRVITKY